MTFVNRPRETPAWPNLAWLTAALFLSVGCQQDGGDVQGRVTIDGNPIADAMIYFQPQKGPVVQSQLDQDGRYHLVKPGGGFEIPPGTYRIYLTDMPAGADEAAAEPISKSDLLAGKAPPRPAISKIAPGATKYYSAATTDWNRDVETGSNEFDFEIRTK